MQNAAFEVGPGKRRLEKKLYYSLIRRSDKRHSQEEFTEFGAPSSARFEPGTIVVFDGGSCDYAWSAALDRDGVFVVTRMKDNADYGVLERRPVPERGPVQRDEIVFIYQVARCGHRDLFLRRIEVDAAAHPGVPHQTSSLAASTIAQIYRQGWQIELFFKALKQNLPSRASSHQPQRPAGSGLDCPDPLLLKYLQLHARLGWRNESATNENRQPAERT